MKYLQIEDDGGNTYTFPNSFWIRDDGWATRSNIANLAYAHGGRNKGDGFIESRVVTLQGDIRADDATAFETAVRNCQKALLKGGKLTVYDDEVGRYIYLKYPTVNSRYTGDYPLEKPFSVSYIAEYPFWQDSSLTTDPQVVAGNDTLTVDNSGSDALVLPIIEIEADQGIDIPSIRMRNQTDGGMEFQYIDVNFVANAILIIDCFEGTVKLNNNDAIQYFKPARFLRLQNGVNTILYEGAAATIRFKWRKIYL